MDRSISFSRGKGKYTHTNREIISDNVDRDRIQNNIIIKSQSLSEAYTEIFGKSQTEFNEKQKRKDRKIDDYFCKLFGVSSDSKEATEVIKNDNKQQSFYEWVIGVGGAYDTALVDWENTKGDLIKANPEAAQLAAECLTEYITGNAEADVKSFEERNPNFHICQAIVHMDEKTPHMHLDVVPFSDGYKKGMSRQQGIAKALEAMDYGTGETAIAKWQESERAVFREICERHGFTIRDEQKSRGYTVLTRQYAEYKENELALEQQQQEIDELQGQTLTLSQSVSDLTEQAEQAKKEVEEVKKNAEQQIEEVKENAEQQIKAYKEKAAEAESSIVNLLDSVQPFEPEQKKPKPNLPEKYDWSKRPPAGRKRNKWDNNREKEQQKIDKEYERYCAEVDERNAANLLKWQEANLTADNLRKAKAMLDKVKTELDERQAALTQDKAQLKQSQSEFESTVDDFEGYVEGKVKERTAELTAENSNLKITVMQQQAQINELIVENDELREELYPSKDYDYGR